MADDIFQTPDITEALPTPSPLIDVEKLELEQEKAKKKFKELKEIREKELQKEWEDLRKSKNESIIINPVIYEDIKRYRSGLARLEDVIREYTNQPKELDAIKSYMDFRHQKNKDRFDKLPPALKNIEIELGGIYDEQLPWYVFKNNYARDVSFNTLGRKHPVYGDYLNSYYANTAMAGSILGTLTQFMALSQIAAATGIPQKLGKLAQKSPKIASILTNIGKPIAWVEQKAPVFFMTSRQIGKKLATDAATKAGELALVKGIQAATVGFIGAFSETTRNLVSKYKTEDQLSEKDWRKRLNAAQVVGLSVLKGFAEKYGISFINAPRGWAMRFIGDSLWLTAKMGAEVMLGQRENWNMRDYWKDVLIGHTMGEIQGAMFAPSRKMIAKDIAIRTQRANLDYAIKQKIGKSYRDPMVWRFAQDMMDSSLEVLTRSGRLPTDAEFKKARDSLAANYRKDLNIVRSITHPKVKEITQRDYVKKTDVREKPKSRRRNRISNLESNLTNDKNARDIIRKNGGIVVSFTDVYKKVNLISNRNAADAFLKESTDLFMDLYREVYTARGKNVKYYIKHPKDVANTKFVIYQKGLTQDQFLDDMSYIVNMLRKNFSPEEYTRRFSFVFRKPDGDVEKVRQKYCQVSLKRI